MNEKHNTLQNFTIIQDGEIVTPAEANAIENIAETVLGGVGRAISTLRLESRMFVFDTLHGTNYRQVRHELVEQKRRAAFEASIGLIAIDHK